MSNDILLHPNSTERYVGGTLVISEAFIERHKQYGFRAVISYGKFSSSDPWYKYGCGVKNNYGMTSIGYYVEGISDHSTPQQILYFIKRYKGCDLNTLYVDCGKKLYSIDSGPNLNYNANYHYLNALRNVIKTIEEM